MVINKHFIIIIIIIIIIITLRNQHVFHSKVLTNTL